MAEHALQNRHRIEDAQLHQLSSGELAPRLLATARQQLDHAVARENMALASYQEAKRAAAGLGSAQAHLDMLQLDWNRLQRTYDIVLERLKDIDLGQKSGMLKTSILSRPEVPLGPVRPRLRMVALLSIVIGLGSGLTIVYLQDLLDDRFRSP